MQSIASSSFWLSSVPLSARASSASARSHRKGEMVVGLDARRVTRLALRERGTVDSEAPIKCIIPVEELSGRRSGARCRSLRGGRVASSSRPSEERENVRPSRRSPSKQSREGTEDIEATSSEPEGWNR